MAAAKGNNYSNKNNRLWADTLRRALVQADGKKLRNIAEALIAKAEEGDISAIREIGDRMDGKSVQAVVGAGENGEHIVDANVTVRFVRPDAG